MDQKTNNAWNPDNLMAPIGLQTGQYRITQDFKLTSDSPPLTQSTYRLKKISIIPLNLENIQTRVKSKEDYPPPSTAKPSWQGSQTKRGEYRIDDFGLFNSAPRYPHPPTPNLTKSSVDYAKLSVRSNKAMKTHVTSQSISRSDGIQAGYAGYYHQLGRKASDVGSARYHMPNYANSGHKGIMHTPKKTIDILGNDSSISDLFMNGKDHQELNVILPTVSSTRGGKEKLQLKPAIKSISPKSKGIPRFKTQKTKGVVGIGDIRDSIKPILSKNNKIILKSGRLFVDSTKLLMDNQKKFMDGRII